MRYHPSRRRAAGLLLALAAGSAGMAYAQSSTSGDVAGTLTDPSGAVIPNATIKVTNVATGESKSAISSATGAFRVSLLSPGSYKVIATAPGFASVANTVSIGAGTITTDDLKLTVGQSGTTIEVSAAPPVLNTENADITTTFTAEQVQALPNPGNDLTFVAQTAPGSVMNTGTAAGGYGNFSSFGISGLSNMFTLDGGYENDPFLNLNNTGASNLTLGNNEVDTVTVVAPAYSSQFGGLGGAQVNEITASGGNRVHGNLNYYWDGRALNSNDYFNKQAELTQGLANTAQFVNANQYGASIGGPIIHDKLFWFVNTEGIRAVTPQQGTIYAPNSLYQNCSLGSATSCATLNATADADCPGGTPGPGNEAGVGNLCDGIAFAPAAPSQRGQLQRVYDTFNNSPSRPASVSQDPNDPALVTYYAHSAELLTEWLLTARADWKISDKDTFYIHYKQDHGTQPTYTDLISPLFTASSPQPAWEGQINETHSFTPNFINQLVLTGNYYSAPFQNNNPPAAVAAAAPSTIEFISGDFQESTDFYGGENYAFPQGRRVSGYQVIDDVSYTRGRNTIRWGFNIRRDNVTDIQGEETINPVALTTEEDFSQGLLDYEYIQRFPQKPTQPVSVYNMGAYIENQFKLRPNLTVTAGLRMERNSNPVCHTNCFDALAASTPSAVPAGTTSPYNAAFAGGLIAAGRHRAFKSFQAYAPMPRISFNYQYSNNTIIRGGFGIFTDSFPGVVADDLLSNVPTNFHAAVYGPIAGGPANLNYDPSTAGSGYSVATASNSAFQTGFYQGQTEAQVASAVTAAGGHFSTPTVTTIAPQISYPTYEEYSFGIDRKIDTKTTLSLLYVGNHGYHEPVDDGTYNLTNSGGSATFFPGVTATKRAASFATISNIYSGASSNYNGVVVSVVRRAKNLSVNFNYQFAKALDEVSNGGFEGFAPDAGDSTSVVNPFNLHSNYGPADYNVKHNVTSNFVYDLPSLVKTSNSLVKALVGGFQFSGDIFHNSGLPYSITQATTAGGAGLKTAFANGSVNLLAAQLNKNYDRHCGGSSHVENVFNGTVANPCNFTSSFATPTNFTQQGRNSLVGPSYTNVDVGAFKTFGIGIPYLEGGKLKLGAQFFNFFNHTNFQNPNHNRAASNTTLGGIASTVGAPTSILGSTGGADASPRLIQLHASLVF